MKAQIVLKAEEFKNIPAGAGKLWYSVTPDGWNVLGSTEIPFARCGVKSLAAEGAVCAKEMAEMAVGECVAVPSGYHPRHGVERKIWARVR